MAMAIRIRSRSNASKPLVRPAYVTNSTIHQITNAPAAIIKPMRTWRIRESSVSTFGVIIVPVDSYAARVRSPDMLMHLQLHSNRETVLENPSGQCRRLQASEHATHQHRIDASRQLMTQDHLARPLVIGAIGEHKLHFVVRCQVINIAPSIARRFAASWTLQVHHLDRARVESAHIARSRGFDQYGQ